MRIALYAEVDANLVEGPAIWLAGVAAMLGHCGCRVSVLLRAPRRQNEVLGPLDGAAGVTLVDPFALGWASPSWRGQLSARRAVRLLERLDATGKFDAVLVRGRRTARAAAATRSLRGRLALYLTDFAQDPAQVGWLGRLGLARTLRRASLLLCQTPEIAAHLRRHFRVGETVPTALLPPLADDEAFALPPARPPISGETLRLVYIGKFAPAWNTLEMTALPGLLARRGIAAELHVAGNKFLTYPDRRFPPRMRAALEREGVRWRGGLPRGEALRLAASGHIGLSWRSPELDGSLELSTKLIDYGALGLPVVCNPTPMHRRLLGERYPFFAATGDEVMAALVRGRTDRAAWIAAGAAVRDLARRHRGSTVGGELTAAFAAAFASGRR
jgi:hypothetical protein